MRSRYILDWVVCVIWWSRQLSGLSVNNDKNLRGKERNDWVLNFVYEWKKNVCVFAGKNVLEIEHSRLRQYVPILFSMQHAEILIFFEWEKIFITKKKKKREATPQNDNYQRVFSVFVYIYCRINKKEEKK